MKKLKHLFSPIRIGTMVVRNRIVMAPTGSNLATHEGEVTQTQINFYEARARGGVGLIVCEDTTIGPKYIWNTLSLADDRVIPGWRNLTKAVHAHGAKIVPQIFHPAFNARSQLNGTQPVSASPIASRFYREIPRELTVDEIQEIIRQFGAAACRAKEGGCDGVQIHCAHMHHLLGSFLTPLHNKRTDQYGGTLEGRLRLPLEVIQRIRSQTGPDFVLIIRISGDEYQPGGRTLEESQYIAPLLVEAGVDAIHVSGGSGNNFWDIIPPAGWPQACNADAAAAIKQVVDVPVICVGRILTPWAAENVLATGKADMVAMARALLADPEFSNKAARGDLENIAPCMGCTMCLIKVVMDKPITCLINPAVGREEEMALVPTESPKKVLVVGGGPAGMEAARVAALRGHQVTLMEKASKLGGQLLVASFPPMKQEYTCAIQYLATQVSRAGVKVELNKEVTPDVVNDLRPDVVVVATGGVPIIPKDVRGTGGNNVTTSWDALTGRVPVGPQIVVIGGGKVGCETADFLSHPVDDMQPGGNQVTIIELLANLALDEFSPGRSLLINRLKSKGVKMITQAKVTEILADGVKYLKDGREEVLRGINTIVLALGTEAENGLAEKLKGGSIQTFVIGDAQQPRSALEAIAEGSEIGRRI